MRRQRFHKKNIIHEKETEEWKKKHRKELNEMLSAWLKTNKINKPKIDWSKAYLGYGNKKQWNNTDPVFKTAPHKIA